MDDHAEYTNRCGCGWEVTGPIDTVVDATIDHGQRIHNMDATREQVQETRTSDPIEFGSHYIRSHFRAPVNHKGWKKSHLDDSGDMVPANTAGTTTELQHIRGKHRGPK